MSDWLEGRDSRAERKAERAEKKNEVVADPEAQAKRAASREKKIVAGLDELEVWLADLVRRGLAGLTAESYTFWDGMAARMVDAQAPGLARQIRALGELVSSGDGWEGRLLTAIARLHIIARGYHQIDDLEPDLRSDLRSAVGWIVNKDDMADLPGVTDEWVLLGQGVEEEDRLRAQWNWLWGVETQRPAPASWSSTPRWWTLPRSWTTRQRCCSRPSLAAAPTSTAPSPTARAISAARATPSWC